MSLATKLRIYTACVLAVGLHGAETWTLLKEDSRRLQAFHMTCQRCILGRGGTGREFRRIPDPGIRQLLPGRIRVFAGSGYLIYDV